MIGNKRKWMACAPRPRPRVANATAPAFTYAEVETALAKVYDAADVQKTAFRGRLKHFRKLGMPQQQPGKGSRISYTESDVFHLMIACELAEFGVDPRLIADIVRRHWRLKGSLVDAIDYGRQLPGDDFHVAIEAHIMSWVWNRKKSKRTATEISWSVIGEPVWIQIFKASDNKAFLDEVKAGRRFFVFNLSQRVRDIEQALKSGAN
jgi:hypothetical protein